MYLTKTMYRAMALVKRYHFFKASEFGRMFWNTDERMKKYQKVQKIKNPLSGSDEFAGMAGGNVLGRLKKYGLVDGGGKYYYYLTHKGLLEFEKGPRKDPGQRLGPRSRWVYFKMREGAVLIGKDGAWTVEATGYSRPVGRKQAETIAGWEEEAIDKVEYDGEIRVTLKPRPFRQPTGKRRKIYGQI